MARYDDLKAILVERKRELLGDTARKWSPKGGGKTPPRDVVDVLESAEAHVQDDIDRMVDELREETLSKINHALHRLEQGTYGYCFECGDQIAEVRLRALPFAIRCKDCEEARETAKRMSARCGGASQYLSL